MVVAVASGTMRMPALNRAVVKARSSERVSCMVGALVFTTRGRFGPAAAAATMVAKKKRAQVTWTSE